MAKNLFYFIMTPFERFFSKKFDLKFDPRNANNAAVEPLINTTHSPCE